MRQNPCVQRDGWSSFPVLLGGPLMYPYSPELTCYKSPDVPRWSWPDVWEDVGLKMSLDRPGFTYCKV